MIPSPTDDPVTASDVIGAISCIHLSQLILSLPVEFVFPSHGRYSRTVTIFHVADNHGDAVLYEVTFTDDEILLSHARGFCPIAISPKGLASLCLFLLYLHVSRILFSPVPWKGAFPLKSF